MNATEKTRISGIVERRPSASAMPTGIEATMPVTDTTSVTSRPPQSRVSTIGNPPRSSPITAITMPMPAKIGKADDQRAPAGADAAVEHEQRKRNDRRGGGEVDPYRAARGLDMIAQPGQRPDDIGQHGR